MAKGYKRHIAKTVTWRILGTLDTIFVSWIISGDIFTGFQIGLAEVFTKTILYFFHERLWFRNKFWITKKVGSRKRHIAKTLTWRVIGTMDTMILAWLISGDPIIGLKVGSLEVVTKMALYYLHERIWYKFDFGIESFRS